jgi:hypothetical protein
VSPNSIEEAAEFITVAVNTFTADDTGTELASARFELYLEGRRHPEFREMLTQVRESFLSLAMAVLTELGLDASRESATALISLMDGLTANQMYHPEFALTTEQLSAVIAAHLRSFKQS